MAERWNVAKSRVNGVAGGGTSPIRLVPMENYDVRVLAPVANESRVFVTRRFSTSFSSTSSARVHHRNLHPVVPDIPRVRAGPRVRHRTVRVYVVP